MPVLQKTSSLLLGHETNQSCGLTYDPFHGLQPLQQTMETRMTDRMS